MASWMLHVFMSHHVRAKFKIFATNGLGLFSLSLLLKTSLYLISFLNNNLKSSKMN